MLETKSHMNVILSCIMVYKDNINMLWYGNVTDGQFLMSIFDMMSIGIRFYFGL